MSTEIEEPHRPTHALSSHKYRKLPPLSSLSLYTQLAPISLPNESMDGVGDPLQRQPEETHSGSTMPIPELTTAAEQVLEKQNPENFQLEDTRTESILAIPGMATPAEQNLEKQNPANLKRKIQELPDSDSSLVENTGLSILCTRNTSTSQPPRNVRTKSAKKLLDCDVDTTSSFSSHSSTKNLDTSEMKEPRVRAIKYRECYISLTQKEARDTCSVRFPLVARRCSSGNGQSLPLLVKKMEPIFCEKGMIDIHASTDQETIFSVTDDRDAALAYDMLTAAKHATVAGTIIEFRQWNPTDEFGFDVAEQRVSISIDKLPLQLWSPAAVEHILSPYRGLEYVSLNTQRRTILRNYRCIAWAQRKIPIPTSILVCIPIDTPDKGQLFETQPYRRVLTYRIGLKIKHYIHEGVEGADYIPVEDVPWYEQGYTTDNAICYLPPDLVDQGFMHQLSNSIIATCTLEHADQLCAELLIANPNIDIRLKAISQTQQIILLPTGEAGKLVQQKILSTFSHAMPELQPWTAAAGSTEQILNVCARITIHKVPAHFCTAKLMHLFLGGYAYMENSDINAERIITCETYRCIVWCHSATGIPQNLLAKVVSPDIASGIVLHADPNVTLRTSKIEIEVRQTASSIQALLDM